MKKKHKKITKKLKKYIKSFVLKTLTCLMFISLIPFLVFSLKPECDDQLCLSLFSIPLFLMSLLLFLIFVCRFNFIEKGSLKNAKRYFYQINTFEDFIKNFEDNIKNDGGVFLKKEIVNNNELYFFNKYDDKIIDSSIYYWYIVVVLNNNSSNYFSDMRKLTAKIYDAFYEKLPSSREKLEQRITVIFVMDNLDEKVNRLINQKGFLFEWGRQVLITGISKESQTIFIPRYVFSIGSYSYNLMKNKIFNLLSIGKKRILDKENKDAEKI